MTVQLSLPPLRSARSTSCWACSRRGRRRLAQLRPEVAGVHVRVQAVAGRDQPVARGELQLVTGRFDVEANADGLGHLVALGVNERFFGGKLAQLDHAADERLVARDLREPAAYAADAKRRNHRQLHCMLRDARQKLKHHGKRSFAGKEAKKALAAAEAELRSRGLDLPPVGEETAKWAKATK
jgi:hypothetical protein